MVKLHVLAAIFVSIPLVICGMGCTAELAEPDDELLMSIDEVEQYSPQTDYKMGSSTSCKSCETWATNAFWDCWNRGKYYTGGVCTEPCGVNGNRYIEYTCL